MPQVVCRVSNCHYWSEGNRCAAAAIKIDVDEHADEQFETEFANFAAENIGSQHPDAAAHMSNTCCQTFEPKHSKRTM